MKTSSNENSENNENQKSKERKKNTRKFKEHQKRKAESYTFVRRLYYFLRHHADQIFFKKLYGGVLGYYDHGTAEITIDHRREVIPTLIHEFIHHIHNDWSETKVRNYERRMLNSLSPNQIKHIIKILANNI